ncbi:MAG: hypothetical protein M1814_000608 [Vezdaea aestivalis]|nr:MAG: hypothetical protein M1814_000608 [Vezdaea aestivalis]
MPHLSLTTFLFLGAALYLTILANPVIRNHARYIPVRTWEHQIRCIGELSPNLQRGFHRRGLPVSWDTPRSLCAKTWYGGRENANYGGYCDDSGGSGRQLFFEWSPANNFRLNYPLRDHSRYGRSIDAEQQSFLHELGMAFCQLRCRCVNEDADTRSWPAAEVLRSEPSNPLAFDKNPVSTVPHHLRLELARTGELGKLRNAVYSFLLPETSETPASGPIFFPRSQSWHRPSCLKSLANETHLKRYIPRLLSHPFSSDDFSEVQELCASVYHGGSLLGNAGFVCEDDPFTRGRRILKNLNHLSHPSFLNIGLHVDPLAVMTWYWCSSVCACNADDSRTQVPIDANKYVMWPTRENLIVTFQDRTAYIKRRDGSDPPAGVPKVLGQVADGGQRDCLAGSDSHRSETCPNSDPMLTLNKEALSLLTLTPPFLFKKSPRRMKIQADGVAEQAGQHGKVCTGPSQCGPSWVCVANPSIEHLRLSGYNSKEIGFQDYHAFGMLTLAAACISLVAFSFFVFEGRGKPVNPAAWIGGVGKRTVEPTYIEDHARRGIWGIECACNETIATRECCEWDFGRA